MEGQQIVAKGFWDMQWLRIYGECLSCELVYSVNDVRGRDEGGGVRFGVELPGSQVYPSWQPINWILHSRAFMTRQSQLYKKTQVAHCFTI